MFPYPDSRTNTKTDVGQSRVGLKPTAGFRVQGLGFRDFGFRDFGFRDFGFRV